MPAPADVMQRISDVEKANVEVVRAFLELRMSTSKDPDAREKAIALYCAPGLRQRVESPRWSLVQWECKDGVPVEWRVGLDAMREAAKKYHKSNLEFVTEILDIHAAGPVVTAKRIDWGPKGTGKTSEPIPAVGIFFVRNGKIVEWTDVCGDPEDAPVYGL